MSKIITASVPFFGVGGSGLIQRPLNAAAPAPVISSVDTVSDTQLEVTYGFPDHHYNHLVCEVYEDAGLTVLNQTIDLIVLDGSTFLEVGDGFNSTPLSPATQYWLRMKLSNDGGSTYSGWSNTGTGTTNP